MKKYLKALKDYADAVLEKLDPGYSYSAASGGSIAVYGKDADPLMHVMYKKSKKGLWSASSILKEHNDRGTPISKNKAKKLAKKRNGCCKKKNDS